jgi:hypothetical protein
VLLCAVAIAIAILLSALCCAILIRANTGHCNRRIADKVAELDRAYRRIDVLEQMLDEVRAHTLNVTTPVKSDAPSRLELPAEVYAELDEIEDVAMRAELEADIRVQMEAHPTIDPVVIARQVLGG